MLGDLIFDLLSAGDDPKLKEQAYRALEKVGVDRRTADAVAKEFYCPSRDGIKEGGEPDE